MNHQNLLNISIESNNSINKDKKKETVFNKEVIIKNQKRCNFLRKLTNKIIKVTNQNYTLRDLKNCALRNYNNMRNIIEECDLSTTVNSRTSGSLSYMNSSKRKKYSSNTLKNDNINNTMNISLHDDKILDVERENNSSCLLKSPCKLNSQRIHKQSQLNLPTTKIRHNKEDKNSSHISNISEKCKRTNSKKENTRKRKISTESTNSEVEDERLKLINELVLKQKNEIFSTHHAEESIRSEDDFENKLKNKSLNATKHSLYKIKKLRQLPDYKKIDKILNAERQTLAEKRANYSFNAIRLEKTDKIDKNEHWNTYSYLTKKIEECVLKREWNHLTKLLIHLADAPMYYRDFFLKTTLINILCNPVAQEDTSMLDGFLKSCYSCQTNDDVERVLSELFQLNYKKDNNKIINHD